MKKLMIFTGMFLFVNASVLYCMDALEDELSSLPEFKEWVDECDQRSNNLIKEHKKRIIFLIKDRVRESFAEKSIQPSASLAEIIAEYATLSDEEINKANESFKKAFHSCALDTLEKLQAALDVGANINMDIDDEGNSMLRYAISYDEPEIVRFLLNSGADVNAKNNYDEFVDKDCNNPVITEMLRKFRNGETLEENTPKEIIQKTKEKEKPLEMKPIADNKQQRRFRRQRPCFIL